MRGLPSASEKKSFSDSTITRTRGRILKDSTDDGRPYFLLGFDLRLIFKKWMPYTVIRFVCVSAKFGTCSVESVHKWDTY